MAVAARPLSGELASWLGTLSDIAGSLWGELPKGFAGADGTDAFAPSGPTSGAQLSKVTQQDLDRWFEAFGDALTVRADESVSGAAWEADAGDHDLAGLTSFLAQTNRLQAPQITAGLTVYKAQLSQRIELALPGIAPRLRIVPFFFAAGLAQALSTADPEDPESFEKDFLAGEDGEPPADRRLLLLVADASGRLTGPWLAVLGNLDDDAFGGFSPSTPIMPDLAEVLKLLRDLRGNEGPARLGITPDFFVVEKSPGVKDESSLDGVARQLTRLQNRLVVPFLANRTGDKPEDLVFEGSRTAVVALGDEPTSRHPYELYRWVFEEPRPARTKLEIARRVIASHLLADTPAENFRELVRFSRRILDDSKVQLRLLTDSNVAASFDRQQKMHDAVGSYVDATGERIRALGKEVVENVYKTVGVLVGVAIAYLLKPDQGPKLASAASFLYALYLLFILCFYLRPIWSDFIERHRSFLGRLAQDRDLRVLPKTEMTRLSKTAEHVGRQFQKQYRRSTTIYWFLIAGALMLSIVSTLSWALPTGAEEDRRHALARQAKRFRAFDYKDVRVDVPGEDAPEKLADQSTGRVIRPDLTAVASDGSATRVVVEHVSCGEMDVPGELERLRLLAKIAAERPATELQILTDPVCCESPGPESLRQRLKSAGIEVRTIWTP